MSKIVTNQISPRSGDTVTVTEKLNVQGVLTYEDVTNIDSVGIITAQSGIKVLADGINAVGVVTATTFSGNTIGAAATFTTDVKIGTETATASADRLLQVGDTSRSATYVEVRTSTSGSSGVVFSDGVDGSNSGYMGTIEYAHSSDQLTFKAAGGTRVTIDGTGNLGATGNVSDSIGPMRRLGIHAGAGVNISLTTGHAGYLSRMTASGTTVTVPADFATAGDMFSVFNVSTGNISIAPAGGVTMYNTADGATGTRTLAAKGLVTILCSGTNEFLISGTGLS